MRPASATERDAEQLAIVVGAGISVPPPSGAPDFRRLRDRFIELADPSIDPRRFELDELSPEQVFEAIDDGREELREAVRRELWWLCEAGEPNPNHFAVAALLEAGVPVWTPNFDTMIERASARAGVHVFPVLPGDDLQASDSGFGLMKPHGSFPYTGDPPNEPSAHDYALLFQTAAVWQLEDDWTERLIADLRDRHIHLFGYRGADPDLTPTLLRGLERSRSVCWWELPGSPNLARLKRLLAGIEGATVVAADPSAALRDLAQKVAPHPVPEPRGVVLARPRDGGEIELSNMSRARLLGQFRGSAVARRYLRRALLLDPGESRGRVLFQLVRSTGFDRWWARAPILLALGVALRTRLKALPRLGELYATMLDARTIRPGDRRAVRRLLAGPRAEQAEILLRVASIEKLHGELDVAVRHGEEALRDAEHRRRPRLAAMAIYNLAWIYRQRGEFERRAELVARYEDRMPHIGFNWAAWLGLDEVLVSLHFGDALRARALLNGPALEYARSLIKHPAYGLDDDLTEVLVRWHENGPAGIDELLVRILEKSPVRRFAHPPFTAIDTLIVLADHARATGESSAMQKRLRRVRRGTSSNLQLGEIELVEAAAAGDRARLERFREDAERRRFGLLARSAEAILDQSQGGSPDSGSVFYRPSLPLAGLY